MFKLQHTASIMFMTKMFMSRFECGSMTGPALQNSENYHVSGFASGSFHAVSTVCPRAPNVERRGSELHQFLQRPDGRLHLTNRVYCQASGLRVTTCPPFCRNFDVMRRHSRKSTASTTCDRRETIRARRLSSGHGLDTSRLSEEEELPGPICVWALSKKNGGIILLRARDVSHLFTGPRSHCRSQQLATCDVRGR